MRLSISIPDDLHKQILVVTAQQQIKILKKVSISDFIQKAIEEKLNLLTSVDDAEGNSATDATAAVNNNIKADGAQTQQRSRCKITPELHVKFVNMQKDGATARQIADAIGCSTATISGLRKKLKEIKLTSK